MPKGLIYPFAFSYLLLINQVLNSQDQQLIDTNWQFKEVNDSTWHPINLPNNNIKALYELGIIPDPFSQDNENKLQYLSSKSFIFKNVFSIDKRILSREKIELHLQNIDTYADIYLNDHKIAECNNAFRIWIIDIKDLLLEEQNILAIHFQPADIIANNLYAQLPYPLPGGERAMVRKPQFHFGWDFGPKFISCGINSVPLIKSYDKLILRNSAIHTRSLHKSFAEIELSLELFSTKDQTINIQWSLDENLFVNTLTIKAGVQTIKIPSRLYSPKLWWPNGSGVPYLYKTKIQISNENREIICLYRHNTGIRTIQLIHQKDQWGKSFYFRVNGRPIFAKGSNYIPQSIFQSSTQDHYNILKDAQECNFNMLRVWGGGLYESNEFYSLCDSMGLMVWQDFMYACAMYPGDSTFIFNARLEAQEQVMRLSKYSCIALWCGNNEINEAWHRWGWQIGLSDDTKEKLWGDYQILFNQILPSVVDSFSNYSSYWESSPLFGRGDKKFQSEGDAHDWGIWHDEMKFEDFEQRIPRFMSEAGFQSLPTLATINSFCDSAQLRLESAAMLSHQKHPRGNQLIMDYLKRDLPSPNNFKDLIYLNQVNQAEGIGLAIKAHRRAKPYCMGTLYWQYNDCWPAISWSSRDYFGRWKALQHKVKELYQPVIITSTSTDDIIEIFASSDLPNPINIEVVIRLEDFSGNQVLFNEKFSIKLQTNQSKRIYVIDLDNWKKLIKPNESAILIQWSYNNQTSYMTHYLSKLKDLELKKPNFTISELLKVDDGFEFELTSNKIAKAVYLEEDSNLQFFPNFIDLYPGVVAKVLCKTKKPELHKDEIFISSLYNYLNK